RRRRKTVIESRDRGRRVDPRRRNGTGRTARVRRTGRAGRICRVGPVGPMSAPSASGACIGVVTFPGSLDDEDALRAVRLAGAQPVRLWHADSSLSGVDAVLLPGGFSYGDYLRCGAIARFSAVMDSVIDAADGG